MAQTPAGSWCVYVLLCRGGRFYTGMTCDVKRRFREHRAGKGGHFTRAFKVKKLLYAEQCPSRRAAFKREAEIKRLTKKRKLDLVKARSSVG